MPDLLSDEDVGIGVDLSDSDVGLGEQLSPSKMADALRFGQSAMALPMSILQNPLVGRASEGARAEISRQEADRTKYLPSFTPEGIPMDQSPEIQAGFEQAGREARQYPGQVLEGMASTAQKLVSPTTWLPEAQQPKKFVIDTQAGTLNQYPEEVAPIGERLYEPQTPDPNWLQKMASGMSTRGNILAAGLTLGESPIAQATKAYFAGEGGLGTVEAAADLLKAKTPQERKEAIESLPMNLAMAIGGIEGLRGKPAIAEKPKSAPQLRKAEAPTLEDVEDRLAAYESQFGPRDKIVSGKPGERPGVEPYRALHSEERSLLEARDRLLKEQEKGKPDASVKSEAPTQAQIGTVPTPYGFEIVGRSADGGLIWKPKKAPTETPVQSEVANPKEKSDFDRYKDITDKLTKGTAEERMAAYGSGEMDALKNKHGGKPPPEFSRNMPNVPEGMTRVYHGEGGPEGAGAGGAWSSTDPSRASSFGENVSYVDLPTEEVNAGKAKAREGRSFTPSDLVLDSKQSSALKPVEGLKSKVHEISEETSSPEAEKPKEEAAKKTWTPAIVTIDGQVVTGASHGKAIENAKQKGLLANGRDQGFVDQNGVYHSRKETLDIFKKETGTAKTMSELGMYSEDLPAERRKQLEAEEPRVLELKRFKDAVPSIQDIRPAVKTMSGGREIGKKGQVHDEIIKDAGLKAEDVDRREFVGPNNEPISREQLAQHPAIETEREAGKAHATDLAKAQEDPAFVEQQLAAAESGKLSPKPPETQKKAIVQALQKFSDEERGQQMLFQLQLEDKSPKQVIDEFWSDTYPNLNPDVQRKFQQYVSSLTGFKPGDVIAVGAKGEKVVAKDWKDLWTPPEVPEHVEDLKGTERGLIAFMETANRNFGKRAETPRQAKLSTFGPVQVAVEAMAKQAAPAVGKAVEAVKEIGKDEAKAGKMTDERRAVLNWSAKEQRSFQEAAEWQKKIKAVAKDPVRDAALTNWIEADGDAALLRRRAAATSDPKLAREYMAAANLTPEEIAIANEVKAKYGDLLNRGQQYDVVQNAKDNYVTHIWDMGKGPSVGGTRTLRDQFKFNRARTFPTFFDGEQAGFVPKTKQLSKILPVYTHEMNHVIASRQLVEEMSKGVASDGRPLVAPRGAAIPVDNAEGKATLVTPKTVKGDTADYKVLPNQPALNDWRWVSKDAAGNPVFLKSDLALHPEAYQRLKAALGRSAIREWYQNKTGKLSDIPKWAVQGLDSANAVTKQTMLGLVSPFHQVQEGWHAIGHRVNPTFNIPKVDLMRDPGQMDAAKHGLMLQPDRASADQFMEGFKTSGLVSKIPGIGPMADWYSNYLFHEYIPGLKYKTYSAILDRNTKVYAKDVAAGKIKPEEVKALSAQQANAAFGHLNYADLGRDPTIRHIMQIGLLAPDFLEARGRFFGQALKGATGAKVGREQVLALATLAIAQAATAYTSAKLTGGTWDKKRPFEFVQGNRRYSMRSVPEDVSGLLNDTRKFIHSRISPIIGKGALQYLSGVNYRGQKVSAGETTKELLQQPIPISVRGFLGVGNNPLKGWEQLAGAVGLRISRYSPASEVTKLADKWRETAGPKQEAGLVRRQRETLPESDLSKLRDAIGKDDMSAAHREYQRLLDSKKASDIFKAMKPFTVVERGGAYERHNKGFAGLSLKDQRAFEKTLSAEDKAKVEEARKQRLDEFKKFQELLKSERQTRDEPVGAEF